MGRCKHGGLGLALCKRLTQLDALLAQRDTAATALFEEHAAALRALRKEYLQP